MRRRIRSRHVPEPTSCISNEIDFFRVTEAISLFVQYQQRSIAWARTKASLDLAADEAIQPSRRNGWCRLAGSSIRSRFFDRISAFNSRLCTFALRHLSQIVEAA